MATVGGYVVLAALLLWVMRPPRGLHEAVFAIPAAAFVLLVGLERASAARHVAGRLGPTLAFVAGIFVIAEVADAVGLFDRAGAALAPLASRGDRTLVAGVAAVALLTTTVLSLDATAVLFTPVVIRLVRGRSSADAALLATVLMANGGSLLLPVANLTNLLVVQQTGVTYSAFFVRLAAPGLAAALVVTWICVRTTPFRVPALASTAPPVELPPWRQDRAAVAVVAGVVLVLAGFVVGSAEHVAPAWIACGGAIVLAALAMAIGRAKPRRLVGATSPGFLAFVLGLAVVVDAASRHGLGSWIDHRVPHGSSLWALAGMALLAALLANVVNNLPATLLLLPALAGRPTPLVLAALLGLNIGPSLTYTGSLATLLWRKVIRSEHVEPPVGRYLAAAWRSTAVALPVAVLVLWAVTRATG